MAPVSVFQSVEDFDHISCSVAIYGAFLTTLGPIFQSVEHLDCTSCSIAICGASCDHTVPSISICGAF
jgi:hypothetical protein